MPQPAGVGEGVERAVRRAAQIAERGAQAADGAGVVREIRKSAVRPGVSERRADGGRFDSRLERADAGTRRHQTGRAEHLRHSRQNHESDVGEPARRQILTQAEIGVNGRADHRNGRERVIALQRGDGVPKPPRLFGALSLKTGNGRRHGLFLQN